MKIYDQTTDFAHQELYRILYKIELPEMIKEAELTTDYSQVRNELFADSVGRRYPLFTPAEVYISNAFFMDKKAELAKKYGEAYVSDIASKIAHAADLFNITEDIEDFNRQFLQKQAEAPKGEHMFSTNINDLKIDLFLVKTAEDFTNTVETFTKNSTKFPFEWRCQIAENLIKKAKEFNVEQLPELVYKYAGVYYPDVEEIKKDLKFRSTKINNEKLAQIYFQELSAMVDMAKTHKDFFKLAEIIEDLDMVFGLDKISKRLKAPIDIVFGVSPQKIAELMDYIELADGKSYSLQKLSNIDAAIYKQAFGIDINPKNRQELKEILPTMPLSDVYLFKELSGLD